MVDFFINRYSQISEANIFLRKVKYYSLQRYVIRILANIFTPLYFKIQNSFKQHKLVAVKKEFGILVSLTTFPARINKIWIVIECMLRQTHPPDRIILWLSKEQFPSEDTLPKRLINQKKRGLEIMFCESDLRSHKKYYYALKHFPEDILITVDDDFIYPSGLIKGLVDLHMQDTSSVCCYRALKMKTEDNSIMPYNTWEFIRGGNAHGFDVFFTSGGGTLFTADLLHKEVLNKEVFITYCKFADDIWLNTMAQMNDVKTRKVVQYFEPIPILNSQNITLSSINVDEGLNDKQLNDVRNYYKSNKHVDPFHNLLNSSK